MRPAVDVEKHLSRISFMRVFFEKLSRKHVEVLNRIDLSPNRRGVGLKERCRLTLNRRVAFDRKWAYFEVYIEVCLGTAIRRSLRPALGGCTNAGCVRLAHATAYHEYHVSFFPKCNSPLKPSHLYCLLVRPWLNRFITPRCSYVGGRQPRRQHGGAWAWAWSAPADGR